MPAYLTARTRPLLQTACLFVQHAQADWNLCHRTLLPFEPSVKSKLYLCSRGVTAADCCQHTHWHAQEETGEDGSAANGMAAAGQLPLMDPVADLKLNQLDVVDAARERQALLQASRVQPQSAAAACSMSPGLNSLASCSWAARSPA